VAPTETASAAQPPAWVLFSGGKDSALAALCLEPFYDVTLVTIGFGIHAAPEPGWGIARATYHAREAAEAIGLPHRVVSLPESVAHEAAERTLADGYPREAIQSVHEQALETVAEEAVAAGDDSPPTIADGTRRDDRVPRLDRPAIQSLEDRHGVDYLVPLRGFGRDAVDRLARDQLEVAIGPSDELAKADYEAAIRTLIRREHGHDRVDDLFPDHVQSRVVGRTDGSAPESGDGPGDGSDGEQAGGSKSRKTS
jgi:predicted subunit of tRNA(5-methylaminomethyl-2-thiouridylate) methyltransferase